MSLDEESVSVRVIERVAAHAGDDSLDLPPLYDAVDPDALDALVATMAEGTVSFAYAGNEVSVDSAGTVSLRAESAPETVPSDD